MRLDEVRRVIFVRLVIRLQYKDGHKTHYASRLCSVVRLERRITDDS